MPADLASFLLLLLFIAPGFLFTRAYWRDWPRYYRDPDLFQQTISAIIASTAIHFLLFLLILIPAFWPEPHDWILSLFSKLLSVFSTSTTPEPALDPMEMVALSIYPMLSLGIGWLGGLGWRRLSPRPLLPWWANLVAEAQTKEQTTRLRVRLRNGEQYVGTLARFFWVGSKETTYELALTAVLREDPDKPRSKPVRMPGQTVLLLSSDILWLSRIEPPDEA